MKIVNTTLTTGDRPWSLCIVLLALSMWTLEGIAAQIDPATTVLAKGYIREKDIPYAQRPETLLDVYSKRGLHGAPVFVFVHGGGWTGGDKATMMASGAAVTFLTGQNCLVVSPNYRLAGPPERTERKGNVFPAGIQDVACAIAWVQRNAEKYGGDPNKIIIGGHSAGAHITALVAYNNERNWLAGSVYEKDKLKIAGFIGWSGPYDWESVPTERFQVKYFLATLYGPGKWEEAEPVNFVTPEDPPALIIGGDKDNFANILNPKTGKYDTNAQILARALTKAGVYCRLAMFPDAAHSDVIDSINEKKELQAPVVEFINKVRNGESFASK